MTALAPTLQAFFTDRLIRQRQASPHTITAYRNTWRLLIVFTAQRTRKRPGKLDFADLDAQLIAAFLDHLEHDRANTTRTRNARLAAIHSLFRFAALRHPEHAADIQRVLAIPSKRADRTLVTYLTEPELDALLASPDRDTWTGRRDHALIMLAAQTGLRASELTSLTCADVHYGAGRTSAATAKVAKTASPRSPPAPSRFCASGRPNASATRPTRCSRPAAASGCLSTLSNGASPTTPSTPPAPARHWPRRRSHHTCCATPRRCGCCTPGSTPS
jgi:integrase